MGTDVELDVPSKGRVLVVDDAPEFVELVAGLLTKEGFEVRTAVDGASALRAARDHAPDLVVLDLSLPDLDGMEVCRQIRAFSSAYIVMLTARDDEIDRVLGLKTGADDYVTKPFSPRELAARVEAMLRRPRHAASEEAGGTDDARSFGELIVRPSAREVEVGAESVSLTRIEFDIIDMLTESPRIVHSRGAIRGRVWGDDWFGDDHVVDVHIANLRKKIDRRDGASFIRTVRGVGYRMEK